MSAKKNKPPLALGMDFNEALHRFARVDPKELSKSKTKKKRPKAAKALKGKD